VGDDRAERDRVHDLEGRPQAVGRAEPGHGLGVPEVSMDILEADFAADVGGGVGPLEEFFKPALVDRRFAHEAHAVGKAELGLDERGMPRRLRGRADDRDLRGLTR